MKLQAVWRIGAVAVIVVLALVIQAIAFDRRLELQRGDLTKAWQQDLAQRDSRIKELEDQMKQRRAEVSTSASSAGPERLAQTVDTLQKRVDKMEQGAVSSNAPSVQEPSVTLITPDLKPTPQFKEVVRGTVQDILKEEREKEREAWREGSRINYETALRKELNELAVAKPVQDQLVKIYQEESSQWGNIWWGEYQSKIRDGSFKDLTPEQLQAKRTEIDQRLKELEAANDQKKGQLLTTEQFQKMKEFEKKYWNRGGGGGGR